MGSLAKKNLIVELQDLDWNFTGETGSDGLFGVHWYPARYVAQVPGILIGYLSDAGDTVLDPFCGSGTTLIEAARQGRRPIGIDTNPVAVLMSNAKLVSFEESEWRAFVGGVTSDVANLLQGSVKNSGEFPIPSEEENRRWYHPETLRELAAVWHALDLADGPLQGVGRAAFSSILRSVCGQDKHWDGFATMSSLGN